MASTTPPPARIDALAGDDPSRYLVRSRVEVAFVLRAIEKAGELITAYLGDGADFVVTAILNIDPAANRMILDSAPGDELNHKLLRSRQVVMVTSQDRVKVQFNVDQLELIQYEGRPAFRARLPASLIKLQRREYYRVPAPVIRPLKCLIPVGEGPLAEATIADLSLGGICIIGQPEAVKLEVGSEFPGCRINLPEIGMITVTVRVCNTFDITLRNGSVSRRSGCAFVDLTPSQEAMVQRFIIRLDRERRAKLADPKA